MTDKTAAWKDNEVLFLLARLVVGLVFLTMGWSKISDPVAFLKLIREYDMVSVEAPWILNSMAALLPWLEIWCGLLLLTGVAVRGASAVAFVLLATFTLAIGTTESRRSARGTRTRNRSTGSSPSGWPRLKTSGSASCWIGSRSRWKPCARPSPPRL